MILTINLSLVCLAYTKVPTVTWESHQMEAVKGLSDRFFVFVFTDIVPVFTFYFIINDYNAWSSHHHVLRQRYQIGLLYFWQIWAFKNTPMAINPVGLSLFDDKKTIPTRIGQRKR